MVTEKEQRKINDFMRRYDIEYECQRHKNCVRIHPKESKEHFLKKCEVAFQLYQEGKPFWTEAYTRSRDRKFDIIAPTGFGRGEITFKGETHEDSDEEFVVRQCAEPK